MNLRRDVCQAIAEPTRRAILLLVASQAMTAGAIAANVDTASPTVSKHLAIRVSGDGITSSFSSIPDQAAGSPHPHMNARATGGVAYRF